MLNHRLTTALAASIDADCVIAAVFDDGSLSSAAASLDSASEGRIKALIESGDVSGKSGRSTLLHGVAGSTAPRLLLMGAGAAGKCRYCAS
jgi:leucyl aminopeptidase